MKRLYSVMACIFFICISCFMLAACGSFGKIELSGKYLNEKSNKVYLEFEKKGGVTLYANNEPIARGRYEVDKKLNSLAILFSSGDVNGPAIFLLYDDNKAMSIMGNNESLNDTYWGPTFIKEKGFWAKHWLKVIIVLAVIGGIQQVLENKLLLEKIMKAFLNEEQAEKLRILFDMEADIKEENLTENELDNKKGPENAMVRTEFDTLDNKK